VAATSWVSFEHLVSPGNYSLRELEVGGQRRQVHGYRLAEGLLWGMTERIVTPILERWLRLG
jgi:hypothetical protein